MDSILILITIAAVLGSTAAIIINRYRTSKEYEQLNRLIDAAIKNELKEQDFDESRMSALETKLARFLSVSTISAQNVAEEKDRIKTLIADISHQTKTPISNLLLYSELLKEKEMSGESSEYVEALYGQTEKLKFLIDSLVKLSRLENGILVLNSRQDDISVLLDRLEKTYSSKAAEKGLTLTVQRSADSPMAVFDGKWTEEALGNIVDNAIKYTQAGGIDISFSASEMFLHIDIKDTGIGIAEEELPKIFGRFYRSAEVSREQGVGIGLYLAREILAAEGGYIKVSSKPDKGSVFSVFLPVK